MYGTQCSRAEITFRYGIYTPYIYCSSYKSLSICWWKLRHRRRGSLIATGLPSSLMIYPALPLQYTSFLVSHECCTATYSLDLAIKWQCRQLINVRRSINVNGRIHTSENIKSVVEAWLINKKGRTRMEKNYEGSHQGERPSFRMDVWIIWANINRVALISSSL